MKKHLGSVLLVVGSIWLTIATCATMIVGFLLWLGVLIWLATSTWGGLIWAGIWLFVGGGLMAALVGIVSLPTRLLGGGLIALGERLVSPEEEVFHEQELEYCIACGTQRVYELDHYCRACGAPYG